MPHKRKLAIEQEYPTKKPKPPPSSTNPQLPQSCPCPSAAASATPSEAPPNPPRLSQEQIAHPLTETQKWKHKSEDEHSPKPLRREPPSASSPATCSKDEHSDNGHCVFESVYQLSTENLQRLERETSSNLDPIGMPSDQGRKRSLSRQTSISDLSQDRTSTSLQKYPASNSFYRFSILQRANVLIRPEPPSEAIRFQLEAITKRSISEEREREISGVAKEMSQEFIKNLLGAHREDDLVELIYAAFRKMYPNTVFTCPRKADWNPSLKPVLQQPRQEWSHLLKYKKPAQQPFHSPNTSQSSMPPPPVPLLVPLPAVLSQVGQDGAIKTPRPDFTIGFHHSTVVSALLSRGYDKFDADALIHFLQQENQIYSDPTQNFLGVRFPILVIEGKAYSTGKTFFEAENQAAVSGSCMINLQQQLIDLYDGNFPDSERSKSRKDKAIPLAFSICTQGPIMEFWVHYSEVVQGTRIHYMNPLKVCYGPFDDGLADFFMLLERLMGWYKDEFLEEVADQLFALAEHPAP